MIAKRQRIPCCANFGMALPTSFSLLRDEGYRQRHRLLVTSMLHTALSELVDAGLIDRTPEQIRLADPLFAHYIRGKTAAIFAG